MRDQQLPPSGSGQQADSLIAAGPGGWRLQRFGRRGRAVGRLLSRVAHGGRPYQQIVDLKLLAGVRDVDARVDQLAHQADQRDRALASLGDQLRTEEELSIDLVRAIEALREAIAAVATRVGDPQALPRIEDLLAASRARPYVEPPFHTWEEDGVGEVLGFARSRLRAESDNDDYKLFEDRFRGPEGRVAELQRPYLPLLDGRGLVLDVGCGRGEMLDLLRERGIAYFGVDPDDAMIARCVEKGHVDVEVVGAIEHLASVPDEHYGAIFCAQVIEHLPHDELGEMLALAVRKLRPDGVFIAETVNPHAPHALRAFWTDLTHQHPIFPEVALSLCELAGFGSAYVFHPTGTGSNDVDSWTQSAYAVVARLRPSSANDG